MNAFVLAAGLGTRLRPLTNDLPKPLIPIFHKPLLTFIFDSLIAAGVENIGFNTHYRPEAFDELFSIESQNNGHRTGCYRGKRLHVFHEPILLDSGGGIRNARSFLNEGPFFLHNGDILADMPLQQLWEHHKRSGAIATLLLKEGGGIANVCFDERNNTICDFRGRLGVTPENGIREFVYGSVAIVEPAFIDWIDPEGPVSIIKSLLSLIKAGHRIAGLVAKDIFWNDLGSAKAYLDVHREIIDKRWKPSFLTADESSWPQQIHPSAEVSPSALLEGMVSVGAHVSIGAGAKLHQCVVLPGATIASETVLSKVIVRSGASVSGHHRGVTL